jgi:site-specific recombinase XerD
MAHLSSLKKDFLEYLEIEKGRSIKTIENYDRYLTRFLAFLKKEDPEDISEGAVREFRLWLNRQPAQGSSTLKKKTQNYYLIALRAFLKFLRKRNIATLQPESIELAKVGERDLDLISPAELGKLLDAPRLAREKATTPVAELRALRDAAMLQLLFSTGLRVSELCSLSRDTDIGRGEFSIRGKGDKVRVVFVSPEAEVAVKAYLGKRKDLEDPMFVQIGRSTSTHAMSALTPRSVERIVREHAVRAGISRKVTPHVIRHSFATDLLHNGADIRSVQALLGHANIATTQVYTHVTDAHLREVHKTFHGRGKK